MKKFKLIFVLLYLVVLSPLVAYGEDFFPLFQMELKNEEDALFLRRLAEFWDEKEEKIIESEITEYLKKPSLDPQFKDYLTAFLGEIFWKKQDYVKAADLYGAISASIVKERIFTNWMQCLFEQKRYDELLDKTKDFLGQSPLPKDEIRQELLFLSADALYQKSKDVKDSAVQTKLLEEAKGNLDNINALELQDSVKEKLAPILALLNDFRGAVEIYLQLANKIEVRKEEFLFESALLQAKFDPDKAIETFGQICLVGKERVKEAAYNRLLLFLETKRYADLILAKDKLIGSIPTDKEPLLHFFIGESYFALQDYKRAASELREYLNGDDKSECKQALLIMMSCAEKSEDLNLFEEAIARFEKNFAGDNALAAPLFVRGMLYKKKALFSKAESDFKKVAENYKNFEEREKLLFEYAHLLYKANHGIESRDKFQLFIKEFPASQVVPLAWRYLLNSSIKALEQVTADKIQEMRAVLLKDIEAFLMQKEIVTPKEREDFALLRAETKYELGHYEEALQELLALTTENPMLLEKSDVSLLLAFSYKNKGDLKNFCYFAEKSLSLDPNSPQQREVHLFLFNAYLEGEKNEKMAAEHLFQAQISGREKISLDHLLWLADFYLQKSSKESDERARSVLEKIVPSPMVLNEQNLFLESKIVDLATLYRKEKQFDKAITLLDSLFGEYGKNSALNYSYKDKALLEIALSCESKGDKAKAQGYFSDLLNNYGRSSFVGSAALHMARILSDDKSISKDSPDSLKALSLLKDLSLQKVASNEPVHLEASFDYVDLQCSLEEGEGKDIKRLTLLERFKENFSQHDDVLSQDYFAILKKDQNKEEMFHAYMQVLEAEILFAKAKVAEKEKQLELLNEASNAVKNINCVPTAYLHERVEKLHNAILYATNPAK